MNTIFTKLRDFVGGMNEAEEYDYYEEEMEGEDYQNVYNEEPPRPTEEERATPRRPRRATVAAEAAMGSRSNVIGMPGATGGISEVVVVEPRSFEEMPQVIQALRERKSVVLNLTIMDPDEAQRAVDFVAGGTYAIDGHQERIGESIFLFTPSCVQVSTQSGGVVHEVAAAPRSTGSAASRPSAPAPAWTAEASRIAQ
ncbi:cell division protein SepF [Oscillatoria salina]|uniref:cell division protein SepF n=1 Tax=Oscillatoria salina TaxID=331517 RepID=UPI0013B9B153|nr:cell division protein SepF [Oscillatoria salina]MBZ8181874.1 cell division protein SepF [Oscillatoria salina IIICB1]NET89866.1 cell division protein SepF [Kamptonema sp. SIO1D9]